MKLLPWILLIALLGSSLLYATTQLTPAPPPPRKVMGVAAATEWVDLESGQDGQAGVAFTVPVGRVLSLVYKTLRPDGGGTVSGTVDIDGQVAFNVSLSVGQFTTVQDSAIRNPWMLGEVVRAGEVVTVTRTGGTAPATTTYFVRGWLEEQF